MDKNMVIGICLILIGINILIISIAEFLFLLK